MVQELSDEQLVARFQEAGGAPAGNAWIEELFGRYHRRVALWCYRFTGERDAAADLAQEVFLRVYRNLDGFRGGSKFSTWLYTVTRNHCLNHQTASCAKLERSSAASDLEIAERDVPNALENLERRESLEAMKAMMEQALDETEKQVMVLHFGQEMRLDAVTRMLGLTNASGARAYVLSAKRKLDAAMKRWNARGQRGGS